MLYLIALNHKCSLAGFMDIIRIFQVKIKKKKPAVSERHPTKGLKNPLSMQLES